MINVTSTPYNMQQTGKNSKGTGG